MFQRREILKYSDPLLIQPVYGDGMKLVGHINDDDLVIVVGDENKPFIKVMLPSGKIGWTYATYRLVSLRHEKMVEL